MQVARAFFQAATKLSDDNEDILPQVSDSRLPLLPVCVPSHILGPRHTGSSRDYRVCIRCAGPAACRSRLPSGVMAPRRIGAL